MTEIGSTPMAVEVEYGKPVPAPDEASRPYFEGTLRGEIMLQRCRACGFWMWPVRVRCIDCFSDDLTWDAASGMGTLYSFTIVHQVVHSGFANDVPYNVAMVDLREGVRIVASVTAVVVGASLTGSTVTPKVASTNSPLASVARTVRLAEPFASGA